MFMSDPIRPVIDKIRNCQSLKTARQQRRLTPNFLNNVAEVFENYGFETTRAYLLNKKEQYNLQAKALLEVLDCMNNNAAILQRRAIGRIIIKTLIQL
jgi:ribosomal protein S8